MNTNHKLSLFYSIIFFATGIFAILGSLYTWGDGPILEQTNLLNVLIPWGDLLITGPLSLVTALGLLKQKRWGFILATMTCGIYIFGSTLVFICLVWNKAPYPIQLVLPPLAGILIGLSYPVWLTRRADIIPQPSCPQTTAAFSNSVFETTNPGKRFPSVAAFSPHPVQQPEI
jgi:cytochrome c oxidase subunit IV